MQSKHVAARSAQPAGPVQTQGWFFFSSLRTTFNVFLFLKIRKVQNQIFKILEMDVARVMLGQLRKEDCPKFQSSLSYRVRLFL